MTLAGGAKRDRIKLYGSAGMYMEPERFAEEAAAIAGIGFPRLQDAAGARAGCGFGDGAANARCGRAGCGIDDRRALVVADGG